MFGHKMREKGDEGKKNRCWGYSLNPLYDAKLEELAEVLGISKSEVLRRAIDEYYFKVIGFFRDIGR